MWITVTSKKHNSKRIELNVKNLNIRMEDVTVLKSIRLTNADFDEDLDWDLSEEDIMTWGLHRRKRRQVVGNETEVEAVVEEEGGGVTSTTVDSNSGGEVLDEDYEENATVIDKSVFYHHPVFPPDDFVTIKILDLEFDESNEKMIIYLGTEMKKDIYYIVKVNFTGNMTNDKGLYWTHYEDGEGSHK